MKKHDCLLFGGGRNPVELRLENGDVSVQLTLFARVAGQLPKNGARITTWSYQDGELQFTIASPAIAPDILFYVKTYSAVAGFTDVTADRADSDRSLRIKLRLARS